MTSRFDPNREEYFRIPTVPITPISPRHYDSSTVEHRQTVSTFIETSPLSTDPCTSPDSTNNRDNHCRMYDNNDRYGGQGPYAQGINDHRAESHDETLPVNLVRSRTVKKIKTPNSMKSSPNRVNSLTWRMDPSQSLSDFQLSVIGVPDHRAIKTLKSHNSKSKGSAQRRRENWNVEGLFLDNSESEDERDNCYEYQHREQEKRVYPQTPNIKNNHSTRNEFYLHRVTLAVGPRSCEYFSRLFRRQQKNNRNNDSVSDHSIELPISSLPALPKMFDFMYSSSSSDEVHATTDTAVSLRYLATVFGNRSLFKSATDFIQNDLRPETAITYLLHADLYRQKKLLDVCVKMCADEFDQIKIRELAMLPPHLMESILYSNQFYCSSGYVLCSKIAAYCRCNENNIDEISLMSLTDVSVMPQIYPEEALFFIKTMISLRMDFNDDNGGDPYQLRVRLLYERCVSAAPSIVLGVLDSLCHEEFADHDGDRNNFERSCVNQRQQKGACTDYCRLPLQVKVDLLEYALAKQKNWNTSSS